VLDDEHLGPACASENLLVAAVDLDTICPVEGMRCADGHGICTGDICVPLPARDEPCTDDVGCAEQLECHVDGLCDSPLGLGSACRTGDRCPPGTACRDRICIFGLSIGFGPCVVDSDCENGLVCAPANRPQDRKCENGPDQGDECGSQTCGAGNTCDRHFESRVCEARLGRGGACADDSDCLSDFCNSNRVCSTPSELGQTCPEGACASGTHCVAGFCAELPGVNEACSVDGACAAGLVCLGDNDFARCATPHGAGQACTAGSCDEGLFCDDEDAVCVPTLASGEPCIDDEQCAADEECGDLLGGQRCHAVPEALSAPCIDRCGGRFVCRGSGGACGDAVCASP
jgi:hypothetical protein